MKKDMVKIWIIVLVMMLFTGCDNKIENDMDNNFKIDNKLFKCLENELGGYIVTENDKLIDIPLDEIKKNDIDKIDYYKGVYASNNKDNMYIIVFPKNGTYDADVMKNFDKYFYERFRIYQKNETSFMPTIYIHSKENNIDFNDIANKCVNRDNINEGKSISLDTLNKLEDTSKIVIKSGEEELGSIVDLNKVNLLLNTISSSKQYGTVCLSDGYGFEFEMYDSNNKLIDIIYVWNDGKRLLPASINGCYYSTSNGVDLRKIIEEETDYIFYSILNFRDNDHKIEKFIYNDGVYNYYLSSDNVNEILIKFMINDQVMTLKNALEDGYILASRVSMDYSDILIRK